ncbi:unnamed protein product [marine sediment metagenome]|uniref:Uncharacterized protein n=1 Tax=marine sediment metagenome TaxID=412755 RepID=X1VT84_9ZZZZ
MTAKKPTVQKSLDGKSLKFWEDSHELSAKGRWVSFTDEVTETISIDEWIIHKVDTPWGKKDCLKTSKGEWLKLDSKRLRFCLTPFVGKKVKLLITRYDSTPNSLKTWWSVKQS